VVFPAVAVVLYILLPNPVTLVMIGGIAQGITLPIISCAALYLRYRRCDPRLAPTRFFDLCLWCAAISISVVACYAVYDLLSKAVAKLTGGA
jgi:hypothetical protein